MTGGDYMDYFSKEYRLFLAEHRVFDAWQYIINTRKNIITANYCQKVINELISQMTLNHQAWLNEFNLKVAKQIEEFGTCSIGIGSEDYPDSKIKILGITADYPFLIDKYIKDFFQYIRNAFDGMAQIINAALLANENRRIERVDFSKILDELTNQKYSALFPNSNAFIKKLSESYEFKYASEFNNLIKHICDAKVVISHELFGDNTTSQIGSFYKKGQQFNEENICNITKRVLDFMENQYIELLNIITEEIKFDTFVMGRIHTLGFYAQRIKDEPNSSFAVVFIEVQNSIDELPDEIRILLLNDKDDVIALNCDYQEILVRGENEEYLGQFICDEEIVNESVLRYRRYKKNRCDGMSAFFDQAKKDNPIKPYFMSGKIIKVGFNEANN
ncbi:MAG TPA: hypothetical protein PKN87_09145 [Syntrophomonadaceae bacterium]|nr:hypothetical protein [Syntrophomonadaceae bacterium]